MLSSTVSNFLTPNKDRPKRVALISQSSNTGMLTRAILCVYLVVCYINKNSSGDEIANVNFCTTTTDM